MIESPDSVSQSQEVIEFRSRFEESVVELRDLVRHPILQPLVLDAFSKGQDYIEFSLGEKTCHISFSDSVYVDIIPFQITSILVSLCQSDIEFEENGEITIEENRPSDHFEALYSLRSDMDSDLIEMDGLVALEKIRDLSSRIKAGLDAQQSNTQTSILSSQAVPHS